MSLKNWICVSQSDVGTVRKVNEDSSFVDSSNGVWCVADGMGGHARGDVASQLISTRLSELVNSSKSIPKIQQIIDCIQGVNLSLMTLSKKHNSIVGSTVAILLIQDEKVHCIWAGDSRVYRLRNKQLFRLTRDHSQVEEMVMAGMISAEEAETHPKANIITRAVGAHDTLDLELASYDLELDDKFLICSDGLNKVMPDNELRNYMLHAEFDDAASDLINIAINRNARDNVTVVMVQNETSKKHALSHTLPLDQTLPLR